MSGPQQNRQRGDAFAPESLIAAGRINSSTDLYTSQVGFVSITKNGTGDYTLVWSVACDVAAGRGLLMYALQDGAGAGTAMMITAEVVSTTSVRIRTFAANGSAAAHPFWVRVTSY